ncbi:rhodanese-like domain-containing protein [bacterium]|nr:rhodanese-like domain-containing protein [bacterium]
MGLNYLTTSTNQMRLRNQRGAVSEAGNNAIWVGFAGILFIVLAFVSLPFSQARGLADFSREVETIDSKNIEWTVSAPNTVIIDARPNFQFELSHIPGAVNVPHDTKKLSAIFERHSLESKLVIVYCSNADCNAAEILAKKLIEHGCKDVRSIWVAGKNGRNSIDD